MCFVLNIYIMELIYMSIMTGPEIDC